MTIMKPAKQYFILSWLNFLFCENKCSPHYMNCEVCALPEAKNSVGWAKWLISGWLGWRLRRVQGWGPSPALSSLFDSPCVICASCLVLNVPFLLPVPLQSPGDSALLEYVEGELWVPYNLPLWHHSVSPSGSHSGATGGFSWDLVLMCLRAAGAWASACGSWLEAALMGVRARGAAGCSQGCARSRARLLHLGFPQSTVFPPSGYGHLEFHLLLKSGPR